MGNKLIEALEVHQELNQKLFDGTDLKEEVKNKLLEIANTFIEGLDFPLNVADIRFLGSNASYNYNEHSDIDLHIISNFDLVYVDKDILQQLYNASKNSFNNNHNITIKGIPVEIYIEDMNSMNATNGSYSLLNDEWVKFPEPIEYEIPDYSKELEDRKAEINQVLLSTNKEEIEYLINDIYLDRKDGLATNGEASIGNLVFKELRNLDLIQKLRDRYNEVESEELTLENKLVETVEENATDDGQIAMKEKEYREYIDTHIANVQKAYDKIVKQYAEDELTTNQLKQLENNLREHDKDKNIPFMFDAYRRNHCPINDEEKEAAEEDYAIAWEYHKNINPHHWEYWLNSNMEFADNIDENEMKLAYFEMLCDWLSFGFRKEEKSATGESTEFETWYNENKGDIKIHPQLEKWFSGLISQILGYIKQEGETLYESKPLTKFENCGKIDKDVLNNNKVGEKEVKKLQEMNYREFKKEKGFKLDYNVTLPLEMTQESDFDTYEDENGRDIEMDYDVDSLMDSFAEAEKEIDSWFSNEDYLKDIFPNVGRGRVYAELIELSEDSLSFNIGFDDTVDPVEEGNDLNLNEDEIKVHIEELAENIVDNIGYLDADQCYDTYSGYRDEDDDPIFNSHKSDEGVVFALHRNGDIQIKSNLTENKKLEETNLSRIFSHYQNDPFIVISAERTANEGETEEEAKQRNKKATLSLKNDIRSAGFGYIPVDGSWKEDGQVSYEASFFIPMSTGNYEDFFKWGIGMCKKYMQYSVLISDGQGNIAYYDKDGNVDMEFKGGISFNQNTIDSNIENAGGVGGYTSLNRKNPNKSFQLQEDLIRYTNHNQREHSFNSKYSNIVKFEESDNNFDILSKYKNADYGFIQDSDLKFIVETLYGKGTKLNEGLNDYGDLQLEYKKGRILDIKQK
ncbi:DUF5662 family protein [uncultured Clostridium sp.]|uniref:DUF5662 family protein n=1 Tax=uncultured Clostridium sp. TaxID=59620 RepID=UPI0026F27A0B|nr:DUF5662 family protein [uncultured Clostridium sp.]